MQPDEPPLDDSASKEPVANAAAEALTAANNVMRITMPWYASKLIDSTDPDGIKARLTKLEALFERVDLQEKAKLDILEHKVKELQQSLSAREEYGREVWSVTKVWLLFIGVFLVIDATAFWNSERPIVSDNVMLAVLTTTTVTVLALFTIVAKYFFPNSSSGKDSSDS